MDVQDEESARAGQIARTSIDFEPKGATIDPSQQDHSQRANQQQDDDELMNKLANVKANMDRLESYNALPEMNALSEMKKKKPRKRRVKRDVVETNDMLQRFNDDGDDDDP